LTGDEDIQQTVDPTLLHTTTDAIATGTYADEFTGVVFAPMATLVHTASGDAASKPGTGGLAGLVGVWSIAALVGAALVVSV
jgi:hypothetical protein